MHLFYVSFLYLAYFHVVDSQTNVAKNLIFVYDVINPGLDYSTFVAGVVEIHDKFLKRQQLFDNLLIIFPFQTSVETTMFDRKEQPMKEYLLQNRSTIEAEKTNSPVSRVLSGLWAGLYNGEPNSIIYVVTNAKPDDDSFTNAILCEIDRKMIEVGFIIQQEYPENVVSQVYQEISLRSNGLVLNVQQSSQIMTFLSDLLTTVTRKVNLLVVENVQETRHTILVDEFLEEMTIATWTLGGDGQYITNHYNHSEYSWIQTQNTHRIRFLCALKTTVESYKYIPIGRLSIFVDTNYHLFGLRVYGSSAFDFNYRFSIDQYDRLRQGDKCICNCTNSNLLLSQRLQQLRPRMNIENYIHISSTNEEYDADFKSCSIIATDNSFEREITLQRSNSVSDQGSYEYYGTFTPGPESFYLQVTASINGRVVRRMSPLAITPFVQSFSSKWDEIETNVRFSAEYANTNYYGNGRPKRQIIKFP